ncbi:hypothetical protein SIN8267_01165 [Sinobacterium norvegicum]|uniref:YhdP central domain-containing protein n=1 Tax=Sinobacterium norvegicum TaxID=1641715 RepID=A0ABM9AED3_9GAMM|nr:YhdP family protein [Sinobacterium norvegicum]CAH0991064.1 hypothetical protein SIN8267_01165 [Sinobacterium norvegicum]
MVKRVIKPTYHTAKYLLLVSIVLVAAYVSLGRYYLPKLTDYRQYIVGQVEQQTGLQVSIEGLSGEWQLLSPGIRVEGFKLFGGSAESSEEVAVSVELLSVQFDALASLAHAQPIFKTLVLSGAEINLQQRDNGSWGLTGYAEQKSDKPPKPGSSTNDKFRAFRELIDESRRIIIENSDVVLTANNGQRVVVGALNVKLLQSQDSLAGSVWLDAPSGKIPLQGRIEGDGDLFSSNLKLISSLQLDSAQLAYFQPIAPNYIPNSIIADGRVNIGYDANAGLVIDSDLNFYQLDINNFIDHQLEEIKQLSGKIAVGYSEESGLEVYGQDLRLDWYSVLDIEKTSVVYQPGQAVNGAVSRLDLAALTNNLLRSGMLPAKGQQALATLLPGGFLNNLHWRFDNSKPLAEKLRLQAELEAVNVLPWKGAPGGKFVSGYLEAGILSGWVDLDSTDVALTFPSVYKHDLVFDQARGRVDWHVGERVTVNSSPLFIEADFGTAVAQLDLDIAKVPSDPLPSTMSLMVGLKGSAAKYRNDFLPYTLPKSLLAWLDDSIHRGNVSEAGFIFHGGLKGGTAKSIQLGLDIDQGNIHFDPAWPELTALSGRLYVNNRVTTVFASGADMLGAYLPSTTVVVDGSTKSLGLSVKSSIEANDAQSVISMFEQTPLAAMTGNMFQGWQASGQVTAALDLAMPLVKTRGVQVAPYIDVVADLNNSNFAIADFGLGFQQLTGRLSYNSVRGLSSDRLSGLFWGKPIHFAINTETETEIENNIRYQNYNIEGRGLVDAERLYQWTQQPVIRFLEGESEFEADIVIAPGPGRQRQSELLVRTDLQGMTVDLPQPYNKQVDEPWPLSITLPIASKKQLAVFKIDNMAELQMDFNNRKMQRAKLNLGSDWQPMEHKKGLLISGHLPTLLVDPWLATLNKYQQFDTELIAYQRQQAALEAMMPGLTISQLLTVEPLQSSVAPKTARVDQAAADKPSATHAATTDEAIESNGEELALTSVADADIGVVVENLSVGQVLFFGQNLNNSALSIVNTDQGWRIAIENPKLTGSMLLLRDSERLKIDVDHMIYPFEAAEAVSAPVQAAPGSSVAGEQEALPVVAEVEPLDALKHIEPWSYPPMDFSIEELTLYGESYGGWRFDSKPQGQGVFIENIEGQIRGVDVGPIAGRDSANLLWQVDGQQHSTSVEALLTMGDIGKVLQAFDLPEAVNSKSASFITRLSWRGTPADIDIKNLQGDVVLKLDKGQFKQTAGSAAEALKIFGVLNFANLVRRLQLDFSDLYSKGLSYDQVTGDVAFEQGVMQIATPLQVKGPSSDFKLTGLFDLNEELVDGELVVTLPITTNLPWVIALAGGLPTAAGVFVASKVFETQFNKISSAVYSIKGSWADPQLKFERFFDVSDKKGLFDFDFGGDDEDDVNSGSTADDQRQ